MKRYLFSIGLLCVIFSLGTAQNHTDALRYSQHTIGGTARSVGMGGAFGALGGDFSSLSHNPAGLGIYRKSEFTFTPEFYLANANTRYFGNEEKEAKFNFNLSNLGYVAVFDEGAGAVSAVNFGIGFNRIANFHRNSLISGVNPYTTYADYMATEATNYGFDDFSAYASKMFFNGFIIDESSAVDSINGKPGEFWINKDYLNPADSSFRPTEQVVTNEERGKTNEWTISLGFNFSDIFYFGGTLGIQSVSYNYDKHFKEYRAGDRGFDYFDYNETLKVRGTGYTGKVGAIVRPIPLLRIGAAFHLPTTYLLKEEYETSLLTPYGNIPKLYPLDANDRRLDALKGEYRVSSPYKVIGSLGATIGKFLILSGDIEYIDYSTMRMKGIGFDLSGENELIKKVYDKKVNIKTGAEVRLGTFYFRGGFGYYGSPYAEQEENVDAIGLSYSGGFGIRDQNMFLDIAYQYTISDERTFLYSAHDGSQMRDNAANIDNKVSRIMTTIGFKF